MTDKNQKNGPKSKSPSKAARDDANLWQQATGDVTPLPGKAVDGAVQDDNQSPARVTYTNQTERAAPNKTKEPGTGIDKRTDERLRRGKMEIEARLDLHGLNQDEARASLNDFITASQKNGKRCVLVITGKGGNKSPKQEKKGEDWFMPQPGVLKQKVPEWLAGDMLRPLIVQTHPAQRHHGGDGALYVLLRRQRP